MAPNVIPPLIAAILVIFIVAGTTHAAQVLVRNNLVCKLCITNWVHEPFLRPSVSPPTSFRLGAKSCLPYAPTLVEFVSTLRGRSVPGSEGQAKHANH